MLYAQSYVDRSCGLRNFAHVSQSITLQDLATLTNQEIEQVVANLKRGEPAAGDTFEREVRSLESGIISAYKIAVYLAKRTIDLKELCEIWKTASEICESILKAMKSLKESRPECGMSQLYDLALDYRNATFKRYQLNLEGLEWEKAEDPAELFPTSS